MFVTNIDNSFLEYVGVIGAILVVMAVAYEIKNDREEVNRIKNEKENISSNNHDAK